MIPEAFAAPVLLVQALLLEEHADRTVEDHDPLPEQLVETLAVGSPGRGSSGHVDP